MTHNEHHRLGPIIVPWLAAFTDDGNACRPLNHGLPELVEAYQMTTLSADLRRTSSVRASQKGLQTDEKPRCRLVPLLCPLLCRCLLLLRAFLPTRGDGLEGLFFRRHVNSLNWLLLCRKSGLVSRRYLLQVRHNVVSDPSSRFVDQLTERFALAAGICGRRLVTRLLPLLF